MKRQRKNKQDMKNIIKTNKAITLIALVVTIVVLYNHLQWYLYIFQDKNFHQ